VSLHRPVMNISGSYNTVHSQKFVSDGKKKKKSGFESLLVKPGTELFFYFELIKASPPTAKTSFSDM